MLSFALLKIVFQNKYNKVNKILCLNLFKRESA